MVRNIAEIPIFQDPARDTNNDLLGLRSQLWLKEPEDVCYYDKAIFAVLKTASGIFCDTMTRGLNEIHIENHDKFLDVLYSNSRTEDKADKKKGVFTVSNHLHYIDDPLLHAAMLRFRYLLSFMLFLGIDTEYNNWKWTPAEKRNFFYNPVQVFRKMFRTFFGRTKTVPILRGQGLEQIAFQKLEEFLQNGDWVHVFGEGTRTRKEGELGQFKPGPGKLIKRAPNTVVIPFGHDGMQEAIPWGIAKEVYEKQPHHPVTQFLEKNFGADYEKNKALRITDHILRNVLKTRKRIQIVIGEPMDLSKLADSVPDTPEGYMIISNVIRAEVEKCLKRAVELNRRAKQKESINEK